MKTAFESSFRDDALVVKSLLESAGIEAEILSDGMLDINQVFVMDVRGIQIVVPDGQIEDARAIVDDFRKNKTVSGGR